MQCIITSSLTFAISVDDKNIVKVWDIQEKSCIQTLIQDTIYGQLATILGWPSKDNFMLANKSRFR